MQLYNQQALIEFSAVVAACRTIVVGDVRMSISHGAVQRVEQRSGMAVLTRFKVPYIRLGMAVLTGDTTRGGSSHLKPLVLT